jgi:hypothetical protein
MGRYENFNEWYQIKLKAHMLILNHYFEYYRFVLTRINMKSTGQY